MRNMFALAAMAVCMNGVAAEFFVATNGCDGADGSAAKPWRTIQRAADVAMAGDVVTIHGGVYREWVRPVNAGRADAPITYQTAKGEKVVVTGADPVRGWTRRPDGLWMAKVRYDSCQGMNPFKDYISGDWFNGKGHYNLRSWLIQDGKSLKTHAIDYFRGQNARGPVLNVEAIYSGSRKMPGFGKKNEHTYATSKGYDFSTPEARRLAFRASSKSTDAVISVFDADSPREMLAQARVKATGGWNKFTVARVTLPDSAANVKNLRFLIRFGGRSFRYEEAAKLLPTGHALLVPGAVTGRILAAFEKDPNTCVPELVTRPACFYPLDEGRDYITVRGITFRDAGPNWASGNGEQLGVVGTHWSRGWVIEDCEVSGSSCVGISLGKYGDEWDNAGPLIHCYYHTIERAAAHGMDRVGHHTVRRCRVFDCGQGGVQSSLGAAFSTVEDNEIFRCHTGRDFTGEGTAGIKLLNSVGVTIARNRIHHNGGWAGIWLDWMAQGVRVSGNVLWANKRDLFFEVDHGPILVEGNTCLSPMAAMTCSQGIAYVGNRMLGTFRTFNEQRCTPVFKPHTVTLESIDAVPCGSGGHVFINNILACDPRFPEEAFPSRYEDNWTIPAEYWKVDESTGEVKITPPAGSRSPEFKSVDANRLGKPVFVDQEFPAPLVCRPKMF